LIEDYEEGGLERLSNMVGQESEHFKKMVTVHEHLRLHPNEQEFDENIEVNNECPKCHYKW